jgi:hypothetical protein
MLSKTDNACLQFVILRSFVWRWKNCLNCDQTTTAKPWRMGADKMHCTCLGVGSKPLKSLRENCAVPKGLGSFFHPTAGLRARLTQMPRLRGWIDGLSIFLFTRPG